MLGTKASSALCAVLLIVVAWGLNAELFSDRCSASQVNNMGDYFKDLMLNKA